VKIGVNAEPGMDKVDKVFEGATFPITIVCPEWFVPSVRAVDRQNAEEEFYTPCWFEERVPFKIKNHIAFRPRWQSREATPALDRQLSPADRSCLLSFELQRRLLA
jgi:hypothetical protein